MKLKVSTYLPICFVSVFTACSGIYTTLGISSEIRSNNEAGLTQELLSHTVKFNNLLDKNLVESGQSEAEEYKLVEHIQQNKFFGLTVSGQLKLINLTNNKIFNVCRISEKFQTAAFDKQTGLLALADQDSVSIVAADDCQVKYRLARVATRFNKLTFHPDHASVLLAGLDSRVYRWHFLMDDPAQGVKRQALALERYFGHSTSVTALDVHFEGRLFFSGDNKGLVFAWRFYDSDRYLGQFNTNSQFGLRGHSEIAARHAFILQNGGAVEKLQLSPSGRYVLLAANNGNVELRKVRGFKLIHNFVAHKGLVYDLRLFNEEPLVFISVGRDNFIRVWQLVHQPQETNEYRVQLVLEEYIAQLRHIVLGEDNMLLVVTASGAINQISLNAFIHS